MKIEDNHIMGWTAKQIEEYAQEVAIAFDNWKWEQGYLYSNTYYYKPHEETPFLTVEQLFEQFKKQNNI